MKIKKLIRTLFLIIGFILKSVFMLLAIIITFGNYATWRIAYRRGLEKKKTNLFVKAKSQLKLERESKRMKIRK